MPGPEQRGSATLPPLTAGPHRKRIGYISVVACLGGLLFGYDTGVSNGAELSIQTELHLDDLGLGVVISSLVFAAAFGGLIGGPVSDRIGRRTTIIGMAAFFFCGTLLAVFSPNFEVLLAGRVAVGLAVGAASIVVPVYLAELAPLEIRGMITGRNELAIVSGQLAAFVINAIIGIVLGGDGGVWRVMFFVCCIPAAGLFFGMLRMPESPRWLVEHGHDDRAFEILKTVRNEERARAELADIERIASEESAQSGQSGLRALFSSKWLIRIVLIGCGVAIAQQVTGINSIMYYGQRILIDAGFGSSAALVANIAPGILAVIGGLIALRNMDRVDRRKTFMLGLSLTTSCHILIGFASFLIPDGNPIRPYVLLFLICAFVLSMQSCLNIAVWVWLAEIFPLNMRGLGTGIAAFAGWLMNAVLALYVPSLIESVGITGTFFLFALIGVIALVFIATQVPETRGWSLEKLEEEVTTGAIYIDTIKGKSKRADRDRA
ncbi:sugar porter family MFS transporter [Curtobacterium pusillum]|uniref:Sugar porter family MFS transporter n=1 Tax=Curtobacterium pusillum TaxID=69373 RepID=A0ABX2MEM4_9MICO|nr:sugar porter family MFS transporter [Curtobacterium pusillum]NUU14227.1 sugar porter family MFS transporter [Curtobacterium pusillum]GLK30664.1 MFS transporter [Curtobacterium pusillum]